MKNLLKADLYRALKNKLLIIGLIAAVGLTIFQVLIYKGLAVLGEITEEDMEIFGALISADGISLWNSGASIVGYSAAYLIPIFVTIFMLREYSDRTVRNKLLMGYTRSQIYFGAILVHLILSFVFLFTASTVGFILGSLFFGLGAEFTMSYVGMLLVGFLLQFILSYTVLCLGIVLAINIQNPVLGIIIPIIFSFLGSLITTLTTFGFSDSFTQILSFTSYFQSTEITGMTNIGDLIKQTLIMDFNNDIITIKLVPLLRILITAPVIISGEIVFGYIKFKRINFK